MVLALIIIMNNISLLIPGFGSFVSQNSVQAIIPAILVILGASRMLLL